MSRRRAPRPERPLARHASGRAPLRPRHREWDRDRGRATNRRRALLAAAVEMPSAPGDPMHRATNRRGALFAALAWAASAVIAGCAAEEPKEYLADDELLDPAACATCHPAQHREWSGSMHAYAADDPVFVALEARGQRDTNGALGDFCVNCHAPMAVRTGAIRDGSGLADLPPHLRGVTCYFCHNADATLDTHNAPLRLPRDGVLRGAFADAAPSTPHRTAYSPLHDRSRPESASLCGSCHDIVTPRGVHLERTFAEWKATLYAKPDPLTQLTCGNCHMDGRDDLAADAEGVGVRRVHDHSMPAVDIALTPFPEAEAQRARVQTELDGSLIAKLCVKPGAPADVVVSLDNAFAGHMWPSGVAHNRRAWVELVAYAGDEVVYQSGVIPDGVAAANVAPADDPDLWLLRDRALDENGHETHFFWEVATIESSLLPPAVTNDPTDPAYYHAVERTYSIYAAMPDRITMRVRMRPFDYDLADELIQSGDLDPSIREKIPTFTLAATQLEWTKSIGFGCIP